jgi:hypothetical protein
MPNMEGAAFDTPQPEGLFVPAPGPQKFAVTTAHQRKAALHQADCSIAQIMGLPGTVGDSLFAEERFGDNAIASAGAASIKRTDRGAQAFAPLFR